MSGEENGGETPLQTGGEAEEWIEVVPAASVPEESLRGWVLVLSSRDIPFSLERDGGRVILRVPSGEARRTIEEIGRYEEENRGWPPAPSPSPPLPDNTFASLSILALVALFHNLTFLDLYGIAREEWLTAGGAEAGRILEGELWRAITALTLHADGEHLLANMLVGAFFIVPLCRHLGLASGWTLLLLAGGAGNLINAMLQNPAHLAVGSSTAIFGGIGVLAGLGIRHRLPLRRRHIPLAAAVALLGLLGSGGEKTDTGAHLFGFLAGVPLGIVAPRPSSIPRPAKLLLGTMALLAPVLAWRLALDGP